MKNVSHLLIIFIISFNVIIIESKIIRKHKHPGYGQSSNSHIEIEPLSKSELNQYKENNNLDSRNINEKINNSFDNNNNHQDINKQHKYYSSNDYREDDEFVYGNNNQQNKELKDDDSLLDLDQELQRREQQQTSNSKNTHSNQKNQHQSDTRNNQQKEKPKTFNTDQEKERLIREQRENRKKQMDNRHNRPHQERVVTSDSLNHGKTRPGGHQGRPKQTEQKPQKNTNQTSTTRKILSLFYQIMMIFFIVSFVYNYFLGKNQNDKHALVWYNSNKEYFEERYEYFGVEDDDNLKKPRNTIPLIKDCKLIKENPYYYKLSCANYRYIRYLTVVLEFHKRYDMTSLITSLFISPKDRLIFQVSFDPIENVGWIFCVSRKKQCKSLKKSYEDLNYFCHVYEPSSFDNYMCLLTESLEMFMELFNNKSLFHYYKSIERYLEAIYYSDMVSMYAEGNNVFFSFNIDLTRPNQERNLLEITHFVNLFVDTLAQLKYSKEFREKVKKSRIMFERTKMDPNKRKEIEEKEKRDFIEIWKIKIRMKNKRGAERKRLERELNKYQ